MNLTAGVMAVRWVHSWSPFGLDYTETVVFPGRSTPNGIVGGVGNGPWASVVHRVQFRPFSAHRGGVPQTIGEIGSRPSWPSLAEHLPPQHLTCRRLERVVTGREPQYNSVRPSAIARLVRKESG